MGIQLTFPFAINMNCPNCNKPLKVGFLMDDSPFWECESCEIYMFVGIKPCRPEHIN